MSELISSAESHLFSCVGTMQEILNAIDDALPKSIPLFAEGEREGGVEYKAEIAGARATESTRSPAKLDEMNKRYPSSGTDGKAEHKDEGDANTTLYPFDQMPDTLVQRLEWEQEVEERRLSPLIILLKRQMGQLKTAIAALGGGIDGQGRVVDVPVSVLDQDIELLSKENVRLGDLFLAKYDKAEALVRKMEEKIMTAGIPSSM